MLDLMRRNRCSALILVGMIFSIAGCAGPSQDTEFKIEQLTIDVNGTVREVRLVIPRGLSTSTCIVAFHGMGDSPESMADYSGLDELVGQTQMMLAYPKGINAMWSTMDVNDENLNSNMDVQLFDAMFTQLRARQGIKRVHLVGMSNGATMAQIVAHARGSQIASVVAHSGTIPGALSVPSTAYPMLLVVGERDLVADSMQRQANRYRAAGHEVREVIVAGLGHQWSREHNRDLAEFWQETGRETRKSPQR